MFYCKENTLCGKRGVYCKWHLSPEQKDFSNLLYEFKGATAQIAKRGFEDIEYAGNDFSRKMGNVKNKYQNERNIQNISQDSNIEEVESNQND